MVPEKLFSRQDVSVIKPHLSRDRAVVIIGARRVGKTCLLHLLMQELKNDGVSEEQILFLDLERFPVRETLNRGEESFLQHIRQAGLDLEKTGFVVLDEIQYLKNPANLIKLIVDHHSNLQLICSGSSALDLREKMDQSLAGRKWVYELSPLTFLEFLRFQGEKELYELLSETSFQKEWNRGRAMLSRPHFNQLKSFYEDYLLWGGYPELALEQNRNIRREYLGEIYSAYIGKDIGNFYRIEQLDAFQRLVSLLAHQSGQLLNINELGNSVELSRPTVKKYLKTLEDTFVINRVSPYYTNKKRELVKMPKAYFCDTGMRNHALDNFLSFQQRTDQGIILESGVCSTLKRLGTESGSLHFWRTKQGAEVDFFLSSGQTEIPVEVKWNWTNDRIPSGLRRMLETYDLTEGILISVSEHEILEEGQKSVHVVPPYLLSQTLDSYVLEQ